MLDNVHPHSYAIIMHYEINIFYTGERRQKNKDNSYIG